MDFEFSQEQDILRDSVHRMTDRLATPEYIRRLDREPALPLRALRRVGGNWAAAHALPQAYGGLEGNSIHLVIVAEELSGSNFNCFTAYGGSVFFGLNLVRKGSEEQKRY